MRYLVFVFFYLMISANVARARNFYFSDKTGNDLRSFRQAQNPRTPWKTLQKLNEFMYALQPGDSVLFHCNEVFKGSIVVTSSGAAGHNLVFAAYGKGKKPVISGFTKFDNWKKVSENIWSAVCSTCSTGINMVIINGRQYAMGRYPNADAPNGGFLSFSGHTNNNQISDDALATGPNWVGAEAVIRVNRWIIDHDLITQHNKNTITFIPGSKEKITDNGYFIQNNLNTLDKEGEWYYDSGKQTLYVFFKHNNPRHAQTEASVIPTLISIHDKTDIVIANICFKGAAARALDVSGGERINIINCDILFSGTDALAASNGNKIIIRHNLVQYTNNNALSVYCSNSSVTDNTVLNTAMLPGLGRNGNNTYNGVIVVGKNNTVANNRIDSTGYIPLRVDGDSLLVKNNFINHFALIKDDAGGIYMYTGAGNRAFTGRRIVGNIVLNGKGAPYGTTYNKALLANGIYMDDNTQNVEVLNNLVADCGSAGIFVHNSSGIILKGNISFNNGRQLVVEHEAITCVGCEMNNNRMIGNVLVAKGEGQQMLSFKSFKDDAPKLMTADSNYYVGANTKPNYILLGSGTTAVACNLMQWQTNFGQDRSSGEKLIKDERDIRLEYNNSMAYKTINPGGRYLDIATGKYPKTVILKPFNAMVLIGPK